MKNRLTTPRTTTWLFIMLFSAIFYVTISSCESSQTTKTTEVAKTAKTTEAPKTPKTDVELGKELYVSYCQMCHGEKGEGGPMADMLKVMPPKLNQISARRDGNFPDEEIFKIIDGQQALEAGHGSKDMPVWGAVFQNSENVDEVMVPKKIYQLIEYLKTIQQ